jgi:hypothetical protein
MSEKILRFPDGRPEPETLRRPRLSVSVTEYFRSALAADPGQRPQLVRKRPTRFEGPIAPDAPPAEPSAARQRSHGNECDGSHETCADGPADI